MNQLRDNKNIPNQGKSDGKRDEKTNFPKQSRNRNQKPLNPSISVVIPLLNEEESLKELSKKLEIHLTNLFKDSWEVLFIDDGSTDSSFSIIREINKQNRKFRSVRFRRNYGKSAALSVGFGKARGSVIVTMDADLQDDPAEIKNLVDKLREGYDLVSGWKKKRYDPISKTLPSKLFNWATSIASGVRLHDFNCGLKAYRRECAKSLNVYGEMHRYLPALAFRDGFKVTEIPVQHHPRKFGKSKFGASRFLKGFLDLITVVFVTRFLKKPLHLFGTLGFLFALTGFTIDLVLSIQWALGMIHLSDKPLVLFGVALIIVGVQLISMGLLGEMIVKNNRENESYSIRETI